MHLQDHAALESTLLEGAMQPDHGQLDDVGRAALDGHVDGLSLGSTPLGIVQGEVFDEHVFNGVRTGQVYLASTDGVWETMNAAKDMFGKDRVQDLLRKHAHMSAAEISERLRAELVRFGGKLGQDDDVTFIVVKVL